MPKAIIIGASTGIGKALAHVLSKEGYVVGLTARRIELLEELQQELPNKSYAKFMDVRRADEAIKRLESLIAEMGSVDLIIVNAGVGYGNDNALVWENEKDTVDVNVRGFLAMTHGAARYFIEKGKGHIVGMSSIAALRGHGHAPAYNASKAFVSNYMEGLRQFFYKNRHSITVTDIKPGFVDTPMTEGNKGLFWVAPPEIAAYQIYQAIKARKRHAYITKRWRLIAWLIKLMPNWLHDRT